MRNFSNLINAMIKKPHFGAAAFGSLLAVLMLLVQGCSKDSSADLNQLLATIPADTGMVISFNSRNLAEKAGCKFDGDKITLSPELSASLAKISDAEVKEAIGMLFSGKAGIEYTNVCVFTQGYHLWITGLLNSPDDFRAFIEKQKGVKFSEQNGVSFGGGFALAGNQFWCLDKGEIDPLSVKAFVNLEESKSFAASDYAKTLLENSHDIFGIVDVASPLLSGKDFKSQVQMQLALQTVFEEPSWYAFDADFKKGKFRLQARVLTSKFKPAKYNFPVAEIDAKTLKSAVGSGNMAIAFGCSQKLTDKISAMLSSAGALGKIYSPILAPLDGTAVLMISPDSDASGLRLAGVVETTGKDLNGLTTMLEGFGIKWKLEDKNLILSTPQNPAGSITPEKFASSSKGAVLALMIDGAILGEKGKNSPFSEVAIAVKPVSSSLAIDVDASVSGAEANALAYILSTFCK